MTGWTPPLPPGIETRFLLDNREAPAEQFERLHGRLAFEEGSVGTRRRGIFTQRMEAMDEATGERYLLAVCEAPDVHVWGLFKELAPTLYFMDGVLVACADFETFKGALELCGQALHGSMADGFQEIRQARHRDTEQRYELVHTVTEEEAVFEINRTDD